MTTKHQMVYNVIKENPHIIAKDIAKETGIGYGYTRVLINRLLHQGKIEGVPSIYHARSHEYRVIDYWSD